MSDSASSAEHGFEEPYVQDTSDVDVFNCMISRNFPTKSISAPSSVSIPSIANKAIFKLLL